MSSKGKKEIDHVIIVGCVLKFLGSVCVLMFGLLSQRLLLILRLEVYVLLSMLLLKTIAGECTTAAAFCCGS